MRTHAFERARRRGVPAAIELDAGPRWYRLDVDGTEAGGPLDRSGSYVDGE